MEFNGDINGCFPWCFNPENIADFGGCCDIPMEYGWMCEDCDELPDEFSEDPDIQAEKPEECCPCCDGTNWIFYSQEQAIIVYEFDEDDIETIQKILKTCGDLPPVVMDDKFNVDYTPFNSDPNMVYWILGHQIIECLKKNEVCSFTVEI